MKKRKPILLGLGVLFLALLLAAPFVTVSAHAQIVPMSPVGESGEAAALRIAGDWPDRERPVTVKQDSGTVAEALETICRQLDLGLVLDAPRENTGKTITVQLVQKPGRDVLAFILESGHLRGELKSGILFVRADASESGAVATGTDAKGEDERPISRDRSFRGSGYSWIGLRLS